MCFLWWKKSHVWTHRYVPQSWASSSAICQCSSTQSKSGSGPKRGSPYIQIVQITGTMNKCKYNCNLCDLYSLMQWGGSPSSSGLGEGHGPHQRHAEPNGSMMRKKKISHTDLSLLKIVTFCSSWIWALILMKDYIKYHFFVLTTEALMPL